MRPFRTVSLAAVAVYGSSSAWASGVDVDSAAYDDAQCALVQAIESNPKLVYNPVSIMLKYSEAATPQAKQLALASVGGTPILEWEFLPDTQLVRVGIDPVIAVATLNSGFIPGIEYAELDWIVSINTTPNDPQYNNLWGMNNTGQTVNGDPGVAGADINAPQAWDTFTGDPNFVIAVIDTGIDRNHPDLAANTWINPGEIAGDGLDNDGNGRIDDVYGWDFYANDNNPMDENDHGTHCSGTIGGVGNNGVGVAGVNWRCKLAALRFLGPNGSGATSGAVSAVNYCIGKNIKVSNNSWGGGGFSQTMLNAINNSANIGHVFVAAAGNSNVNIDASPSYPASYNSANLIAVAATDNNDNRASFSNYGASSVDVGAPGVNILSSVRGTGYAYFNGTSMATPHVSGLAALLYGRNPTWTAAQIKTQIMSTARPVAALSGRCVTGGVINAQAAIGGSGGNTAPSVNITAPSNGATFGQGISITFTGTATDAQQGNMAASLIWTSNLSGQIGTGGSFANNTLVGGVHVITATVTDSGGLIGSASVTITVVGAPAAPSNCVATAITTGFAQVTWIDNSNNETSFELERERRDVANAVWVETTSLGPVAANSTSYLEFVTGGQRYRYRVRAVNAAGPSAWSNWYANNF
jgi:hypothetical protein